MNKLQVVILAITSFSCAIFIAMICYLSYLTKTVNEKLKYNRLHPFVQCMQFATHEGKIEGIQHPLDNAKTICYGIN